MAEAPLSMAGRNNDVRVSPLQSSSDKGFQRTPAQANGMKCELKYMYAGEKKCRCCINWQDEMPISMIENGTGDKNAAFVLIVRKEVAHENSESGKKSRVHSIVVQSSLLLKLLEKILQGYPGLNFIDSQKTFKAPFRPFLHRWKEFSIAVRDEQDPETKAHLDLLFPVLEAELKIPLDSAKKFAEFKIIDFPNVWTIFRPEELVYSVRDGIASALRLIETEPFTSNDGRKYLLLKCYTID